MFLYDVSPCKDCKKRTAFCHSNCQDYIEWKKNHDIKRAEIVEKERIGKLIVESRINFCDTYLKKTKHKRRK